MSYPLATLAACIFCTSVYGAYLGILETGEDLPGGTATHHKKLDRNSFSHPSANLNFEQELEFKVGNAFFRRVWVSSPSSTQAADGLGPLFNSRSCQRCHIKDGRGHPPLENETTSESLLLRLSIPPQNEQHRTLMESGRVNSIPEPVYGGQLQHLSVQGVRAEGKVNVTHNPYKINITESANIELPKPAYEITNLAYGPLHDEVMVSPRVAPQMIGLGLLESVSANSFLAHADPDDLDKDGVSGKPNMVWSSENQRMMLGRFGHKASVATINEQNQGAFSGDIGLSTPLHPNPTGDCTDTQLDCFKVPDGSSPQYEKLEAHSEITQLLLFYTRNLGVPARREHDSPDVLEGKKLFHDVGCAACHVPTYTTPEIADRPEHSNQKIWPYTDLLLHDMGDGLADNRPDGQANGREWRTAPLWGVGLTGIVNGHTRFLHDGRARTLEEAVLWHGGESAGSRAQYYSLTNPDKQKLLQFVNSL